MSEPCQFVFSPPEPPDPWCLTHRCSANDCKARADARIATLEAVLQPFAAPGEWGWREKHAAVLAARAALAESTRLDGGS